MDDIAYQVQVDQSTAAEWASSLDLFEDANIYQTWSYGAVRWGEGSLSHLVLRRGGEVVAMAQFRIARLKWLQAGVAYLRWGPICIRRGSRPDPEIFRRMIAAIHEEYAVRRGLLLRIVPGAVSGSVEGEIARETLAQYFTGMPDHAAGYRTFLLELTPSLDELRKNLDRKWRNHLNQAEKGGLKILEGYEMDLYHIFVKLYKEMWLRKKFDEGGVDVEEFGRIQELLPKAQRMKTLICEQGGNPVAGMVCSAMGNTGIYLLGATSDAGLQSKGSYLLQWEVVKWLKQSGLQYYDLGGINPEGNPGVYSFKRGFSGRDVTRLAPVEAAGSVLSSVCIRGAEMAQKSLRAGANGIARLRSGAVLARKHS